MGGIGSGRGARFDSKMTVDRICRIDIRSWCRKGLLVPGTSFAGGWYQRAVGVSVIRVWVEYDRVMVSFGAHAKSGDCVVQLCTTPCNFGSGRLWFACPGCGRRAAVLYLAWGSFACRQCFDLAYPSQRESPGFRAATRASKIRRKLGSSGALQTPFPEKPKGMHWRTYERLRQQEAELTAQFSGELEVRTDSLKKRLDRLL